MKHELILGGVLFHFRFSKRNVFFFKFSICFIVFYFLCTETALMQKYYKDAAHLAFNIIIFNCISVLMLCIMRWWWWWCTCFVSHICVIFLPTAPEYNALYTIYRHTHTFIPAIDTLYPHTYTYTCT